MPEPVARRTSAALHFSLVDTDFTVFMRVSGEPEKVRKALREACSHRRRLVVSQGPEYFVNCVSNLNRLALDSVQIWKGRKRFELYGREYEWNYQIDLQGAQQTPHIHYHSQGKDITHVPLFQFLGTEHKRLYEWTEKRKKNKGGRPKELWLRDNLFEMVEGLTPETRRRYRKIAAKRALKEAAKVQGQQSITKGQKLTTGIPLDLKHKRHIKVDFTGVESVDRSRGERISLFEDAALGDEYERELDKLYETESGAQP